MNIAVLLTCHNRCQKTNDCLKHLYNNKSVEGLSYDVYLVNDGCTDGTPVIVNQSYPEVKIIDGDGNLFWNRGMYVAWEASKKGGLYDGVLWLNDDTLMRNDALETLYNNAQKHPDSILVGTIRDLDDNEYTYGGYIKKNEILKPAEDALQCYHFNGNIVYVPTSVSDKIGILDYCFRHSKGDFEYGIRARKNGINCYAIPCIGNCNRNSPYVKWMDEKLSLTQRFKVLYSPLGNNPFEAFHLLKQTSYKRAITTFIYLHAKVIAPSLFPNRSKIS